MLGFSQSPGKTESEAKKAKREKRTAKCFEHFRQKHMDLAATIKDPSYDAVCAFLSSWNPEHDLHDHQDSLAKLGGFGVFQVRAAREYIHERAAPAGYWEKVLESVASELTAAPSLMTGRVEALARLNEPKIKGVWGGQSAGTLLVSFDKAAFRSHGKAQGANAPISEQDAFRYCSALNHLLRDKTRRAQIGDTTIIFWSAKPHPIEDITGHMIAGIEDEARVREVEAFLGSVRQGLPVTLDDEPETPFYVLGLAPNASRLSVRYWHSGTAGDFRRRLAEHARALELDPAPETYKFPSIRRLVGETVMLKNGFPDDSRISPVLAGELARSILTGAPYPRSLLTSVVRRIRIEGFVDAKNKDMLVAMHRRACIIKACLTRSFSSTNYEVPMSLNAEHPEPAYQLGRLFAVLEKTQTDAYGSSLNSTIRSKYMGAASATPSVVFPRILRLHIHHLAKIEHPAWRINNERLVTEICGRMDAAGFPAHLSIEGQGLFFLGYYQQRQALYTPKQTAEAETAKA